MFQPLSPDDGLVIEAETCCHLVTLNKINIHNTSCVLTCESLLPTCRLQDKQSRYCGLIPSKDMKFFSSPEIQTSCRAHTVIAWGEVAVASGSPLTSI